MQEDKKFNYVYSSPTEEEKKFVASIKKEYEEDSDKRKKVKSLVELDKKVKALPTAVGVAMVIAGILTFGLGLTFALEWKKHVASVVVGLLGVAVASTAMPVRNLLYKKNKKKYSKEILALATEILDEE